MVGIVWYKREDYDTLRKLFTDSDQLQDTYDEWLSEAERVLNNLQSHGQNCRKVFQDPRTFPAWCAERSLEANAAARSEFGAWAVLRKRGANLGSA